MNYLCVIAAGGSGSRFGSIVPKQFLPLGDGSPVLHHAARRLTAALADRGEVTLVTVIDPGRDDMAPAGSRTAAPGATRWESVRNALEATADVPADVILVHDGARPLPSARLIRETAEACLEHDGAIPVVAVTDSLRRSDGSPANRAEFRAVQTPQAFRADLLREAYRLPYREEFTDDASVMSAAGFTDIALTPGDPDNIKITLPRDLKIAEIILAERGDLD